MFAFRPVTQSFWSSAFREVATFRVMPDSWVILQQKSFQIYKVRVKEVDPVFRYLSTLYFTRTIWKPRQTNIFVLENTMGIWSTVAQMAEREQFEIKRSWVQSLPGSNVTLPQNVWDILYTGISSSCIMLLFTFRPCELVVTDWDCYHVSHAWPHYFNIPLWQMVMSTHP